MRPVAVDLFCAAGRLSYGMHSRQAQRFVEIDT